MIKILFFLSALSLSLAAQPRLTEPHPDCPQDFSHHLLPHEWDCTKFYYCEWGQKFILPRNCAAPLHFKYETQECVWPRDSTCTLSGYPPTDEPTTTTDDPTTTTDAPTTEASTTTTAAPTTEAATTNAPVTTAVPSTTTAQPTTTTTEASTTTTTAPTTEASTTNAPVTTTAQPITTTINAQTTDVTTPEFTTYEPTTDASTTSAPVTTTAVPSTSTNTPPTDSATSEYTTYDPTTDASTIDASITTTAEPSTTTDAPSTEPDCPDDVSTEDRKCQEECNILPWAHDDCDKFWTCNGQKAVVIVCAEGLFFNPSLGTCDFPCNTDCVRETVQATAQQDGLRVYLPWNKIDEDTKSLLKLITN